MQYHLRRAASVLVAMSILIGLPVAGGAWLSSGVPVEPIESFAADAAAPAEQPWATIPEPPAAVAYDAPVDTAFPDPTGTVTEWVCAVDDSNGRCLPEKLAAALLDAGTPVAADPGPAAIEADAGSTPSAVPFDATNPEAPTFDRLIPLDPQSAEGWRGLVEVFFRSEDVNRALDVIQCESRGVPTAKNPRSTASGLFQHLASYWPERSVKAGYEGTDVFDPVANVAVAAWLVYEGGGWSHWNPSKGCWG